MRSDHPCSPQRVNTAVCLSSGLWTLEYVPYSASEHGKSPISGVTTGFPQIPEQLQSSAPSTTSLPVNPKRTRLDRKPRDFPEESNIGTPLGHMMPGVICCIVSYVPERPMGETR
jgi:hypothetical protein